MKQPLVVHGNGVVAGLTVRKHFVPPPGATKVVRKNAIGGGSPTIVIRVPVSSTGEDRDGDEFSTRGVKNLADQLSTGKAPYYLDHGRQPGDFVPSYSVLDMLGKWTAADDENGLLYGTAELDGGDPRAIELARKMEAGLPIGHSVGFMVLEADQKVGKEGEQTGKLVFHKVDLMECSAVGIPSNPDAVNDAITILARTKGMTPDAFRKMVGVPTDTQENPTDMELTTAEKQQIEAQRKAGKDGAPAPAAPETAKDKPITAADLKAALDAQAPVLGKAVADALAPILRAAPASKGKEEDEEEKEEEGEEEEDGEKAAPPATAKSQPVGKKTPPKAAPKPRAIATGADTKAADEESGGAQPDTAKEVRPFAHA